MNKYDIIFAPVITEKSEKMKEQGKYAFKVDAKATKPQIKKAIESIFNVKVEKINTLNSHPKRKEWANIQV